MTIQVNCEQSVRVYESIVNASDQGLFLELTKLLQDHPLWFEEIPDCFEEFDSSNVLYIMSNEINIENIIMKLQHLSGGVSDKRLYVGVGGLLNYDLILTRNPNTVLLLDINDRMPLLHQTVCSAIQVSDNPDMFIRIFFEQCEVKELSIESKDKEKILKKEMHWLKNQENFEKIKKMFTENRIQIEQGSHNLADPRCIDQILSFCESRHLQIDVFYISNVADWLCFCPYELVSLNLNLKKIGRYYFGSWIVDAQGTIQSTINQRTIKKITQQVFSVSICNLITIHRQQAFKEFRAIYLHSIDPQ